MNTNKHYIIENECKQKVKDIVKKTRRCLLNNGKSPDSHIYELESSFFDYDKNKDKEDQEAMSIAVQIVNIWAKIRKDALAIAQVVNGAKLTALKDRNRQAKAICVALIGRKSIKESYDDHSYNEGASFLSELNFI